MSYALSQPTLQWNFPNRNIFSRTRQKTGLNGTSLLHMGYLNKMKCKCGQ